MSRECCAGCSMDIGYNVNGYMPQRGIASPTLDFGRLIALNGGACRLKKSQALRIWKQETISFS